MELFATADSVRTLPPAPTPPVELTIVHEQTSGAAGDADDLRVVATTRCGGQLADQLWDMYAAAFRHFVRVAAMKQMVSPEGFRALLHDEDIEKYVVMQGDQAVAMSTMTTRLSTENVNTRFFERRYSEHYANGRLFYLGFLLVRPSAQHRGIMPVLVQRMSLRIESAGGVVCFDICGHNDRVADFARMCEALAARCRPAVLSTLDVQTYYALDFAPLS